ncbi:next to BRCA1 gene 1 protein-like isoform X2 [Saccoglossus kowalevskii]|uniref:Next to BRCA1 gene 1 protein-like isoform X2 n=1 Tax=Saccoglossus kowalevskii TaxID=10224 RepID=A0ABM0MFS6_SACKO|nr:PREDICTED: next to BRCA1 gene 1 protein-like isoform X2 [Saccoglossus kowalevskii]
MSENFALAVRTDSGTNVYQLTYDISWENFEAMIKCVLDQDKIRIKYVDEENDEIYMNSDEELAVAKTIAKKSGDTMNITVEKVIETPDVPESPTMATEPLVASEFEELIPVDDNDNNNDDYDDDEMEVMEIVGEKERSHQMVPQIVQGVLKGLNGAVIESIHGTSGQPQNVPPQTPSVAPTDVPPEKTEGAAAAPLYCHVGIICDHCGQTIVGIRYKCGNCADFDLCEQCEAIEGIHNDTHVLLKMRRPAIGAGRKDGVLHPLLNDIIYKETVDLPIFKSPWWQRKLQQVEKECEKKVEKAARMAEKAERKAERMNRRGCDKMKDKTEKKIEKMKEKFERREEKMKRRLEGKDTSMPSKKEKVDDDGSTEGLVGASYTRLLDKMDAVFVRDGNIPDDTHVQPGTKFVKHWVMSNRGTQPWDSDTRLKLLWGSIDILCSPEMNVPPVAPGNEGSVSVEFEAPTTPGHYQSHWRMCHKDKEFGHRVWCSIIVDEPEVLEPSIKDEVILVREVLDDLTDKVEQEEEKAVEAGETVEEAIDEVIEKHIEKHREKNEAPSTDVQHDDENPEPIQQLTEQDLLTFELLDINESNTPNNTPSDLTPRISPLPSLDGLLLQQQISRCSSNSSSSLSVEIIDSPDAENMVTEAIQHLEITDEAGIEDETASILSQISNDTLDDFCVVPLPDCFNTDLPLTKSISDAATENESTFSECDSVEMERQSVDDILATSHTNTQQEPLIPVTLTSNAASTVVSTITVAISPASTTWTMSGETHPVEEQDKEEIHSQNVEELTSSEGDAPNGAEDEPEGASATVDVDDQKKETREETIPDHTGWEENTSSDNLDREEPSFDPVRAMEYAGGLAVQAFSAAAGTANNVVHAIFNQKVPPRPEWPKQDGKNPPSAMEQLIDMGFCNRQFNAQLLEKHHNNLERVVQELLNEMDNEWSNNRH